MVRSGKDGADTLIFKGLEMEVKTMPVDTASFQIHDIKGQILYPVTFKELLPWIGGGLLAATLIALAVWLIVRESRRKAEAGKPKDPAYIVALRELDKYRSDKYWAPEKQKAFYSGITDTLKFYMDDRFGVDAPEMTTAELFDALKSDKDITPEMYSGLKDLFERADFVKFAKHIATDEENARALPLAVSFVTTTYQADIQKEASGEEAADDCCSSRIPNCCGCLRCRRSWWSTTCGWNWARAGRTCVCRHLPPGCAQALPRSRSCGICRSCCAPPPSCL